ncbi:hypothetical protein ACS0TY_015112 [Phlomoides rotata]
MEEDELRKGPWLEEEDDQLAAAVAVLGDRRWDALAKTSGLKRSGKSCRLRWMNYLRPNLKHGNISADEERIIVELHEKWGNRWSKIARRLPGRTDNEIKNYWRSYLKKNKKGVVLEKECFINNSASGGSLRSECETSSPCSIDDEWFVIKDEWTPSPYETRPTDWMSNWNYDFCSPEWFSGDCSTSSVWDVSLWDG